MIVFFRADINFEIGTGHIKRCITLADCFLRSGYDVCFIVNKTGSDYVKYLSGYDVSWIDVGRNVDFSQIDDLSQTMNVLEEKDDVLCMIVDNYRIDYVWEKKISEIVNCVVVIDDYRNRIHFANILVSDINVSFGDRLNRSDINTKELLGKEYALIDKRYVYNYMVGGDNYEKQNDGTLLVTYGGSDPTGETIKVLRVLSQLNDYLVDYSGVDVVVGGANNNIESIIKFSDDVKNCQVHYNPNGLFDLMRRAKLVLTSGGNTLIESLAMCRPSAVTITAKNQYLICDQLQKEECIYLLGFHSDVTTKSLMEDLKQVLTIYPKISSKLIKKQLYDGLGSIRIVRKIEDFFYENRRKKH